MIQNQIQNHQSKITNPKKRKICIVKSKSYMEKRQTIFFNSNTFPFHKTQAKPKKNQSDFWRRAAITAFL
jgi:hypothetical protein